jgi:hypothetical protein
VDEANHGRYTAVPYRYFGRAKKSRNAKDDMLSDYDNHGDGNSGKNRLPEGPRLTVEALTNRGSENTTDDVATKKSGQERLERALLPRMLCFLSQTPTQSIDPDTRISYSEYYATNVQQVCL